MFHCLIYIIALKAHLVQSYHDVSQIFLSTASVTDQVKVGQACLMYYTIINNSWRGSRFAQTSTKYRNKQKFLWKNLILNKELDNVWKRVLCRGKYLPCQWWVERVSLCSLLDHQRHPLVGGVSIFNFTFLFSPSLFEPEVSNLGC